MRNKIKVMQHSIAIGKIGGPNSGLKLLVESNLNNKYDFIPLYQTRAANGFNITLLKEMTKEIKKNKPDILHIRGLQSEGLYGIVAGKLAGCNNIVLSVHGFYGDVINLNPIKKFLFTQVIEPLSLILADSVYCVCKFANERQIIRRYARNSVGYIHNAAPDYSQINASEARRKIRSELNINSDEILVVSVGRVTIDKGYEELKKTIEIVFKKSRTNIKFLIVGEGTYLSEMKKKLEDYKELVHFLSIRTDIPDILHASDLFVFSTLHENLSNALLEANAAGLPSVVTNVGGNSEVVEHGYNGLLVNPKKPQEMADAIIKLAKSEKKRTLMGKNAKIKIEREFNQELIFSQIDEVYQNVLK